MSTKVHKCQDISNNVQEVKHCRKSSNAYELSKLQTCVVAIGVFTGMIASMFVGIIFLFPIVYAIEDNGNDSSSIIVPFAEIKPVIDGKFTSYVEWADANVTNFNSNGYDFYLLTKQNKDFVYMMFNGVDFQTDPKRDDLSVGYQIVPCFDGDNDKGSKRGLGDFCHNSIIYHEFGKFVEGRNAPIKFDSNGQSSHLDLPGNFQAGWNYGNQNDLFEESDHLTFEMQVPRILFESTGDVGFTFQMYVDSSTDVIQLFDGVNWPPDTEKKIPSTWATLILSEKKCPENLNLIFKASDNSPACVKEQSIMPLKERGWGCLQSSCQTVVELSYCDGWCEEKELLDMGCTVPLLDYLHENSNMFGEGYNSTSFSYQDAPLGVSDEKYHECADFIHIKRSTLDSKVPDLYKDKPEVVSFYAKYKDAQFSVAGDQISYFAGSDDGFKIRMSLYFDENHEIYDMELHCYYQSVHQYEVPSEDIVSKLEKYDCGK